MKAQKIEISVEEAEAILDRVQDSTVAQEDYEIIKGMVETLLLLNQAVTEKNTSIKRLLQVIFGHKTEKKKSSKKKTGKRRKKRNKGHGKNGADEYTGASREEINHDTLQHCDPCPVCEDGKLYRQQVPGYLFASRAQHRLRQRFMNWKSCGAISAAKYSQLSPLLRPELKNITKQLQPCLLY